MAERVGELRRETVPQIRANARDHAVVVRVRAAFHLVDGGEVRKRRIIWTELILRGPRSAGPERRRQRLIDIEHREQMMSQAAHVTNFHHGAAAHLILRVERIVLQRSVLEALIDRKDAVRRWRQRGISENRLAAGDGEVAARRGKDRTRARRIINHAGCTAVGRAVVAERVQIGRIIIDAVAAAQHQFAAMRLVSKSKPGRDIAPAARVQRVNSLAHEDNSLGGEEGRKTTVVIEERTEVLPPDTIIQR